LLFESTMNGFMPKSVAVLRHYSWQTFFHDLVAGVTVGLVALPLAMAFAISSGVAPEAGIYTAVVAGFLVSALGGSRLQIAGPTGAFVVVIYNIVAAHGLDGLFMCTLMAGVMLIGLGVTGLGKAVKFIPRPVIVGFTNGIAVLIASTQLKDFFGLQIDKVPGEFVGRMESLAASANTASWRAIALAGGSLIVIVLIRKFAPRVPGYIVALALGTILAAATGLSVETIGSRFGGIPTGLPAFAFPHFDVSMIRPLLPSALTVALLGAIESLLSAVVADRMSGDKHNPNVELVAQGIANVISPLFGGLPATGAIARTATNVRSGAKTPVAGMIHALTLLCVLLFAAPLAKFIPLAVLSAILLVVAYNMGEWHEIPKLLKLTWADISVWAITFALTVFADLTLAVQVGMVLASLLFIRKVTGTTTVTRVTQDYVDGGWEHIVQGKPIPDYVALFRIHGPFLFGANEKVDEILEELDRLPPIVILKLRDMTAIDATGLQAFEDLAYRLRKSNRTLILCGAPAQPSRLLLQSEFEQHVGEENICPDVHSALERAIVVNFNRHFTGGAA
jgi:SulP family sulfate permease